MIYFFIILLALVLYFVLVFILSHLFIPHLGFDDDQVPEKIPADMLDMIKQLAEKAGSAQHFLELSYEFLGKKYRSERFNTVLKFNYLFKDLDQAWQASDYMPCTQSNFLLRIFLIKSGFFKDDDIKRKYVFANFVPHQYLQVRVNEQWINVDVGEKQRGLSLGKYLKYFG